MKLLREFGIADLLFLAGAASLGTGLWMLCPEVCLITLGALSLTIGVLSRWR